jgi:hypothetical protein
MTDDEQVVLKQRLADALRSRQDLAGIILTGANLAGFDFTGANLPLFPGRPPTFFPKSLRTNVPKRAPDVPDGAYPLADE